MIKYILVDDEPKTLERVKKKIDTIAKEYDLQHVKSYDRSKIAFEEIQKEDYDVLIVDFEMPVYNGLELAEEVALNKKIIFLTSTTNNEQEVINTLDIAGYLSKPFEIDEFETILKNKVIGKINTPITNYQKGDLITLGIGVNKDFGFYPERILYILTSNKNCVSIYGENDTIIEKDIIITITKLAEKLKFFGFEKINQSTIINTNYIKNRDNVNLSLHQCKQTFKIGNSEKAGFIKRLREKLGV